MADSPRAKGLKELAEGPKGRSLNAIRADAAVSKRRRIAWLLADGWTIPEIAARMGISTANVTTYAGHPEVKVLVDELQNDAEALIKDKLSAGEGRAAECLLDLMDSAKSEQVRLQAAVQFLDRMGIRGRPLEKIQQQNVNLTGDAAQTALVNALRDPGVRAFLENRPDIKQKLLLPAQEEPYTVEEASPSPSEAPQPLHNGEDRGS